MLLNIIKVGSETGLSRAKDKLNKFRSRVDDKLPLQIKIGDIIDFEELLLRSSLIEEAFEFSDNDPETDHSYLELHARLPDKKKKVVAIFKSEIDGFLHFWFYFEDNDFLEIVCRKESPTIPIEDGIRYFSFEEELIPEANEEELFLPNRNESNTWWIGNKYYPLPEQDLDDEGVWEEFSYQRVWGISEDLIPPKNINGEIFTDPFNKKGEKLRLQAMLYVRPPVKYALDENLEIPDDEYEYFQIQAVTDQSGLYIQMYFGVSIEAKNFEVIDMNV